MRLDRTLSGMCAALAIPVSGRYCLNAVHLSPVIANVSTSLPAVGLARRRVTPCEPRSPPDRLAVRLGSPDGAVRDADGLADARRDFGWCPFTHVATQPTGCPVILGRSWPAIGCPTGAFEVIRRSTRSAVGGISSRRE